MPEEDSSRKQLDLYDSTDKKPEVQYELVKVPLQDQVSIVRKSVCSGWNQVKDVIKSSVTSARVKVQDQLVSVGIKNPTMVMQASAVCTAGLLGLLLARKRSTFGRILYPVLAGGVTWEAIYLSNAENRQSIWNQTNRFKKEYVEDTQLYKKITNSDNDKVEKR